MSISLESQGGIVHVPTVRKRRIAGSYVLNSAAWADVDAALDLVLPAKSGDVIEYGISGLIANQAVDCNFDVATIVAGNVVNYLSSGGNVPDAFTGWYSTAGVNSQLSGSVLGAPLVGADIEGGNVTLRLRYKEGAAVNRTLYAEAGGMLLLWAKNLQ